LVWIRKAVAKGPLVAYLQDMDSIKDDIAEMIKELPEGTSLEDIQYHLYVLEKVQNGQQAIRDGNGVSHTATRKRLAKWLTD